MASRQDQLHSYQFSVQRVVAALVLREPDAAQSPGRRLAGATLAGLLLAALSLAGITVYGLVKPGSSSDWQAPGTVIVEQNTGARYVFLDGKLHPVLNYASARLLAGASAKTATVSAARLAGVARGASLGIPDAPDSLPGKGNLAGGAWSLCSARLSGGSPLSVLYVGSSPTGGHPLGDNGLLAQTPDGTLYLLWHASALRIPQPQLVRSAFSWGSEPVTPVAPALIDAVGAGPDLVPPQIPGGGQPTTALPGYPVGTVLVSQAQGGAKQYGVVLAAGLAPISQVQADLLLADPDLARVLGRAGAREISQAQFAQAPVAALADSPDALPRSTPGLAHPGSAAVACAAVPTGAAATITVDATVDAADDAATVGGATAGGGRLADRIVVPPGHGALVEAVSSATATGGALCLVTDVARRYPLPSTDVAALLGYAGTTPVRVPSALVALVPAGPVLDPAAAGQPS